MVAIVIMIHKNNLYVLQEWVWKAEEGPFQDGFMVEACKPSGTYLGGVRE